MNCPDDKIVDHKDGDGLNNHKTNLRVCNYTQNHGNKRISKNNKSGIKGVHWSKEKKKWVSYIHINKKRKHLGYFSDINEAKSAYTKVAKQHFGEFYSEGLDKL